MDSRWASECPNCEETCQEDIAHILLECSSAAVETTRHIQPILEWFAGPGPALSREDLATLILGGQASGVDPSQKWLGKATQTRWRNKAPFLMVADIAESQNPTENIRCGRGFLFLAIANQKKIQELIFQINLATGRNTQSILL